jgi:hypothetical protein
LYNALSQERHRSKRGQELIEAMKEVLAYTRGEKVSRMRIHRFVEVNGRVERITEE